MARKVRDWLRGKSRSPEFIPGVPPGWQKNWKYAQVGKGTILANTSTFSTPVFLHGKTPQVKIGADCLIHGHFALTRPEAKIQVGDRTQIGNSHILAAADISIGSDVIMAWGIVIMDSDNHSAEWEDRADDVELARKSFRETNGQSISELHNWSRVKTESVVIGDKCWIGFGAVILKGVRLGHRVVVGANSVVTRDVPSGSIVAGNPAKIIGKTQSSTAQDSSN